MDGGRPPIEAIQFNQEDLMRLQSLDPVPYNENLREKKRSLPMFQLIESLSLMMTLLFKTLG